MGKARPSVEYHFFPYKIDAVAAELGKDRLLAVLRKMLLIRNFEIRAEGVYQQGKIGGFFHAYIGQEAIQTAAVEAIGKENWWTTSYRCHALALLLDATPNELMAELMGKATGNAKGRGGSMHFFTDRLTGGFGIVGGQIPIATGAAFTVKYKGLKEISTVFFGDGAVAQGALHESLNLAALWELPCLYVIENNQWGMGTAVNRAIAAEPIAEKLSTGYGMQSYTLEGMDFFQCYAAFKQIAEEMRRTSRPVLVEVITERFRGHSISDPALYRSKEELSACMKRDPIQNLKAEMIKRGMLDDAGFEAMDKEQRAIVVASIQYAEESPWPDPLTLGEDVLAP